MTNRCIQCHQPMKPGRANRPKLFCSALCKQRDKYARKTGKSKRKPHRYTRSK